MENVKNNNTENNGTADFSYTYSAKEQAEIKMIREKYMPKKEDSDDKMALLRKLDAGVNAKAQGVSLTLGILGALVMGFGMSLIMTELSVLLCMGSVVAMIVGITMGIAGGALAVAAYPIYKLVLKRERAQIAPRILSITEELMR